MNLKGIIGIKLPDKMFLKHVFKKKMGKNLNLREPKSFNEKMQWLKLYDRNSIYTTMVDKYEAKVYVSNIIGEEYIIPTLGIWDKFEDINFEELPEQFVLKCTHDSGGLVICRDKKQFDFTKAKDKINMCLKKNYYYAWREWPYKNVKPRIIAEKYMVDSKINELRDFKFFCFDGRVRCYKVDFDRFADHHANYYDKEGNLLPFGELEYPPKYDNQLEMPDTIIEMERLAEKLSQEIPFLRVDFYDVNGKIYFGELTFYPASGLGKFTTDDWDETLGGWIKLPR